ncbi:hypothetical protein DFJ74DRAFT_667989 [Hyaloraphidium curvatum]|nr:hypothetical protein DFJ74DRAFT_667989 [Hyaloraphidium curvatum]
MHALLLFAAAVLALAGAAAASPLKGSPEAAGSAVFRRSCADCDPEHFCEFGHPDAPADTVACVVEDRHSLYRRYGANPNDLCAYDYGYPGSRKCNTGVNSWVACDWITGLPVADGSDSATGHCNAGCCLPRAYIDSWCSSAGPACSRADKTTEMAVFTSSPPLACDRSTGVVGSGAGQCRFAGSAVGQIGGCCATAA